MIPAVTPYFDSGVLIKLYIRERNSATAAQLVQQFPFVSFNQLHALEIANTFHTLSGRGLITVVQRTSAEHHLASDIASTRLRRLQPEWQHLFQQSLELARDFSSTTLTRSLAVLHVAAAILAQASIFVTADKRQFDLACLTGLDCRFLE